MFVSLNIVLFGFRIGEKLVIELPILFDGNASIDHLRKCICQFHRKGLSLFRF